jgi:O-antigen/teichoic acid export membrane protein
VLFIFAIPSLIIYTIIANKQSHQEVDFWEVMKYLLFWSVFLAWIIWMWNWSLSLLLQTSIFSLWMITLAWILSLFLAAGRGYLQWRSDFFGLGKNILWEVLWKVFFVLLVFYMISWSIEEVLIAINISIFLAVIHIYFYIFRHHKEKHHFEKLEFRLETLIKTSISIIGVTLLYNIDMILVRSYVPEISWDYSVISRLSQLTILASMIFIQLYSPKMIQLYKNKYSTKKEFIEVFLIILLWGSVLSMIYFFFWESIISLLFWNHFWVSKDLLALSNIGFVIFAVWCLIQNYLVAIEKYFVIIIPIISCVLYLFLVTFFHNSLVDFVGILFITFSFYTLLHLIYIFGFRYDVSMQK